MNSKEEEEFNKAVDDWCENMMLVIATHRLEDARNEIVPSYKKFNEFTTKDIDKLLKEWYSYSNKFQEEFLEQVEYDVADEKFWELFNVALDIIK